jgi:eukaryotic-like serine/threonine-protein kinase
VNIKDKGMNGKYVLNSKYAIRIPTRQEKRMAPKVFNNHSVLEHKYKNTEYIISSEITGFLSSFRKPNTLENVINRYHRQHKLPLAEVGNILESFFSQLKEKRILVTGKHNRKPYKVIPVYLKVGEKLGKYSVIESFVTDRPVQVYKVKDENNRIMILKIAGVTVDKHYLNRLRQEHNILANLKSSKYTIRATGHFKNHLYEGIVVDYFEGAEFSDYVGDNFKKLSITRKSEMGEKILKACSYLHKKGIIHGDIHLSNILVNSQEEIRLIDFGLANHSNPRENLDIRFGGANFFMPPERITEDSFNKFSKEPDYYSDVYQAGLIIYFLFFGQLPYTALLWKDLAGKIKKGRLVFPAKDSGSPIIAEVKKILAKAINNIPENRYRTATQFYHAWKKMVKQYDND